LTFKRGFLLAVSTFLLFAALGNDQYDATIATTEGSLVHMLIMIE
jgi:hypothetical protein